MLNAGCAVLLGDAAGCTALKMLNAGCAALLGDAAGCTALRSINHAEHQWDSLALLEEAAGCTALLEDGAAVGCTETPTPLYIGVF